MSSAIIAFLYLSGFWLTYQHPDGKKHSTAQRLTSAIGWPFISVIGVLMILRVMVERFK